MNKLTWVFSCFVLIVSGLYVRHISYGDAASPTVGTIEFMGAFSPAWYRITAQPVKQIGIPIAKITKAGALNAIVSNVLPPGTQLYEIQGVDHNKAIAVPWDGRYVEAVGVSS